jgi:hypothetical protein
MQPTDNAARRSCRCTRSCRRGRSSRRRSRRSGSPFLRCDWIAFGKLFSSDRFLTYFSCVPRGRFFVHFFPRKITFSGIILGISREKNFWKLFPQKIFPRQFFFGGGGDVWKICFGLHFATYVVALWHIIPTLMRNILPGCQTDLLTWEQFYLEANERHF